MAIRKNGNKVEEVTEQIDREWTLQEARDELSKVQTQIDDIENMKQRRLEYLNTRKTFINEVIALLNG